MGRKKINRTGEKNINNFGSEMIIINSYIEFNNKHKRDFTYIDIYFPEYDWTAKHREYKEFKKGSIVCPHERRTYGVGYLGEGKYKSKENGKFTKCYKVWNSMLQRCYDSKYHEKYPTYKGCKVCEEWLCFQNFAEWFYDNYYKIENETMCLDKDILIKHNKIYTPETCIFVPQTINLLFTKSNKSRGNYPLGVDYHKASNKFRARCSVYDFKIKKLINKYLGLYNTQEKAFEVYKQFKENHIKEVANHYKGLTPEKLYNALYNYEVEIDD